MALPQMSSLMCPVSLMQYAVQEFIVGACPSMPRCCNPMHVTAIRREHVSLHVRHYANVAVQTPPHRQFSTVETS